MKTLVAALLLLAGQAPAQQERCISPAEAGRIATALLPSVIESLARQCTAHLPANAFLGDRSRLLAERIRSETADVRPSAVATMMSITGQDVAVIGDNSDQMIAVLAASMTSDVTAVQCRGANDLIEALAPLPTANFAQAFGAVLGVAAAEAGEDAPPICRE
ncbi:MAG TPA: hypothetical protein VF603_05730 [Allosphingosinicella sp.]|jgi:hypothetical protein